MRSFFIKVCVIVLLFGLGIFYGVDLASKGVGQIYGTDPTTSNESEQLEQSAPSKAGYVEPEIKSDPIEHGQPANTGIPANDIGKMHRLASSIGSLLQGVADALVEIILSIFDGLLK